MTRYERVHTGDVVVALVVVITQIQLGRLLYADWKRHLSPRVFLAVRASLILTWVADAAGILLTLIHFGRSVLWIPTFIRSLLGAFAMVSGIVSSGALVVYFASGAFLKRSAHAPGRRRLIRAAAVAGASAPIAVCGFGVFIERTRYRVIEINLPIPDLHPDLEGLRVVQISDLHVSPFLSLREAARVIDMVNELRPRLVFLTGDLISDAGDPLDAAIAELGRLRAEAGVLGCLGNHEIYADCEAYTAREARRRGIEFLRGESRPLRWGDGILNVAGVDYQPFHRRDNYLQGADKLVLPGVANLLLSHNPDVFPTAVRQGYDAVVAGHTHGGQVTIEILRQTLNFARFFTPYVAGLYRLSGRSCYVNAGIGTIGMPVRIGAFPEITQFQLRRPVAIAPG